MKHKHADLIHAWADGAEIQEKHHDSRTGRDIWETETHPEWNENYEYRLKPQAKGNKK